MIDVGCVGEAGAFGVSVAGVDELLLELVRCLRRRRVLAFCNSEYSSGGRSSGATSPVCAAGSVVDGASVLASLVAAVCCSL
jgi:hypothetical protein